ncbi:hypothetical protein LEP1GSC051_2915 [Leptospira sp. P2653]|nr:hypothetical protein LEP1GSC051_2915 [Leptospira sp. P2653]
MEKIRRPLYAEILKLEFCFGNTFDSHERRSRKQQRMRKKRAFALFHFNGRAASLFKGSS